MLPAVVVVPALPPLPAASLVLVMLAALAAIGALSVLGAVVRASVASRREAPVVVDPRSIPAAAWQR